MCCGKFTIICLRVSVNDKSDVGGTSSGGDGIPKIVSHLSSMYVKDGEPVTLQCRVIGKHLFESIPLCSFVCMFSKLARIFTGAERFDVVWLHNNKEIKPSKDFEYSNVANIYKLNIAEIFPEDSGVYTCEAFNDAGESFSSCTILVLGTLFCAINYVF